MRINQSSANLDKDLSYNYNPMNLLTDRPSLTYAYLKSGSRVNRDD